MALRYKNDYGFIRVSSAVPEVNVADVDFNVDSILKCYNDAKQLGAQVLVCPELCVTAYTCADLFNSELLIEQAELAIDRIKSATKDSDLMLLIGAPIRANGHLFNCAIAMQHGDLLGAVPKTHIPNDNEFCEKRWFASHQAAQGLKEITINDSVCPFGVDLLFDAGKVKLAVEVGEDLRVPIPPSSIYAVNGANVLVNLSASNDLVGKQDSLEGIIRHQSRCCMAAYVYASAGYGESTTDLVFSGNSIIAENGLVLAQSRRFARKASVEIADIDIQALDNERRVKNDSCGSRSLFYRDLRHIPVRLAAPLDYTTTELKRPVRRNPFVPKSQQCLKAHCEEIVNIQTEGLMRRMEFTGIRSLVVGVSGGLDSTLALLVANRAFHQLGYDRKDIHGITMPGFGTTGRTHSNAAKLMKELGVTVHEIPIQDAVKQHLKDIGHDLATRDVTYENAQARERTQILMDYANQIGALVLGTGDLSELALGWATYNGDHMSMYNVNVNIPKTLARHLVRWFALSSNVASMREILFDVISTPISPELTPADEQGNIAQKTEDLVGPYELHDFFIYHTLRHGYSPRKLFLLATVAFKGCYDKATIKKWLTKFVWRFFSQQFKRSCLPDGPKVGCVGLSPRGDWRMPSDASPALWIKECNEIAD